MHTYFLILWTTRVRLFVAPLNWATMGHESVVSSVLLDTSIGLDPPGTPRPGEQSQTRIKKVSCTKLNQGKMCIMTRSEEGLRFGRMWCCVPRFARYNWLALTSLVPLDRESSLKVSKSQRLSVCKVDYCKGQQLQHILCVSFFRKDISCPKEWLKRDFKVKESKKKY